MGYWRLLPLAACIAACQRSPGDSVAGMYAAAFLESDPARAVELIERAVSPSYDCLDLDRSGYLVSFGERSGSAYDAKTETDVRAEGDQVELEIRRDVHVPATESGLAFDSTVRTRERRRLSLGADRRVVCDRTASRSVDAFGSIVGEVVPPTPQFNDPPFDVAPGAATTFGISFRGVLGMAVVHADWAPNSFPSGWQDAEEVILLPHRLNAEVVLTFPGPAEPGQDSVTVAATALVLPENGAPIDARAFATRAIDVLYREDEP